MMKRSNGKRLTYPHAHQTSHFKYNSNFGQFFDSDSLCHEYKFADKKNVSGEECTDSCSPLVFLPRRYWPYVDKCVSRQSETVSQWTTVSMD